MKKVMLKFAFVIMAITGTVVTLNSVGVKTVSEAHAAVTSADVEEYLLYEEGFYQVNDIQPKPNTVADWLARVSTGPMQSAWVTVQVSGGNIIGWYYN